MLGLPASTEIRKAVPKTVIYEKFPMELNGDRKKRFENDIGRIVIVNEISEASVNIREGEEVKSIFAVLIELKDKDYNEKNISLIARLFGQKLILILHSEDNYKLAIYQTKILSSEWFDEGDKTLKLEGLTLDNVWQNLVSQISGIIPEKERSLDEQILHEGDILRLRRQIDHLESQAKKETQSKKKYELHQQILDLKKQLEGM